MEVTTVMRAPFSPKMIAEQGLNVAVEFRDITLRTCESEFKYLKDFKRNQPQYPVTRSIF